jgi:hypothetical protein
MKFEMGPMSVGDMLDRGLKMLTARLPALFLINFLVELPVMALQLLLPFVYDPAIIESAPPPGAQPTPEQLAQMLETLLILMAYSSLLMLFSLVLTVIGTAATLHLVAGEFVDRHVSFAESFGYAFRRFGSLLLATFLFSLMLGAGFCLCLVPGFFLWTIFAFVGQIVVLERLSAIDAFSRSAELTSGFRWRVLGMLLLLLVIRFMVAFGAAMIGYLFPSYDVIPVEGHRVRVEWNYLNFTGGVVFQYLVNILPHCYGAVCLTLFYFDLRIRKEGFDLAFLAQQPTAAPGPSGAGPEADFAPPSNPENPPLP